MPFQITNLLSFGSRRQLSDDQKTDPARTIPDETDPAQTDSIWADAVQTMPAQTDPAQTDSVWADAVQTIPAQTAPVLEDYEFSRMTIESPGLTDKVEAKRAEIVIGIDFGTTFSGAAWASTDNPIPEVISQWPATGSNRVSDSDKVPTTIAYEVDGIRWGYGADDSDNALRWFKLLFSDSLTDELDGIEKEPMLHSLRTRLRSLDKTPMEVAADYLGLLWQHVLDRLQKRVTKSVLDSRPLRIILSVPAVWSHTAQEKTRRAAIKAGLLLPRKGGLTALELVSEPEAATLATYADADLGHNPGIKQGDTFIVCDAGGGTVDLIGYEIKSFTPLELREAGPGAIGGLYGATYVDRAFWNQVCGFHSGMAKLEQSARHRFLDREWDGIKRTFDGGGGPWHIEIPAKARKMLTQHEDQQDEIKLTADDINVMFEIVVPRICDLIDAQMRDIKSKTREPKIIILVGGFGENVHLYNVLTEFFPRTTIQQPRKAWSAICRGAVLKGLQFKSDHTVKNHISKYNYGTNYTVVFDPKQHDPSEKRWSPQWAAFTTHRWLRWYLRKGDDILIHSEKPVQYSFSTSISSWRELDNIKYSIFYSAEYGPGDRPTSDTHPLCDLFVTFPRHLFDKLPAIVGTKHSKRLVFTLEMHLTVSNVKWKIIFDGESMETRVKYHGVELDPT